MKPKLHIILILLLLPALLHAQNLVPNPSFEDYSSCPNNLDQTYLTGWTININSANFFHACANGTSPDVGVPDNIFGYQYPPDTTCNAYAGFYAFSSLNPESREFIGTQLNTPLIIDEKYYVSFKVILSNHIGINCGVNGLGAVFTNVDYGNTIIYPPIPLVNNTAHIYDTQVITDTAKWTRVKGSFIADSAYQNIVIGLFFDNDNTIFECFDEDTTSSYYYLDDVCVSTDSAYCWDYIYTCDHNSIKNTLNNRVNIYPNPAKNHFIIEIDELIHIEKPKIELYTALGRLALNKQMKNKKTKINIDKLTQGIYFVKIQLENEIVVKKLVIN